MKTTEELSALTHEDIERWLKMKIEEFGATSMSLHITDEMPYYFIHFENRTYHCATYDDLAEVARKHDPAELKAKRIAEIREELEKLEGSES